MDILWVWAMRWSSRLYELGPLQKGLLTSLNLIGACLASLVCFRYADDLGRKLEVQIGATLYLLGAAIAAASPVLWGIYAGFTVYGLGIGFAMHAAPVYIAEVSPASIRGMLVSAKEAIIVCGMFLGFFFGWACGGIPTDGWRIMVAISAVFALVMGVGVMFIPESPRFLVLKAVQSNALLANSNSELLARAHSALKFFRGGAADGDVADELEQIRSDISASIGSEVAKVSDTFKYPKPLIIGCGLVFLQQVTGQPSVLYYATNIFKSAGFGSLASLSSVFVGLVKLLATLFTVWRVDKFGRVLLLTVGIAMMVVALACIGTAFLFRECETPGASIQNCEDSNISLPQEWAVVTVAGLMMYVSGYQVGFGPISWLMISEIFPLKVRGGAMSVAAIVNFSSNILMTLLQQVLQDALTPAGLFFAYLVLSVVSIAFVRTVVPETKGKTLEQIEAMLAGSGAREVCTA
eukprot:TRINITY_DN3105_c0_g1_i1.p1 TRINITY_DN3105_c0_g1~~TRINITY_DN3105_c0_g1_i1.p1  ORF type:complete len:465 (-),score=75.46 TRINITY_DN3105_c0_g1_i1:436-1830(-)